MRTASTLPAAYGDIHAGIVELREAARHAAARSVNALMTANSWEIGRRIVEFEQGGAERSGYGEGLLKRLSESLARLCVAAGDALPEAFDVLRHSLQAIEHPDHVVQATSVIAFRRSDMLLPLLKPTLDSRDLWNISESTGKVSK